MWQRRVWEYVIRDDRDYQAHRNYIQYNPVKHGLVSRAADFLDQDARPLDPHPSAVPYDSAWSSSASPRTLTPSIFSETG